ncbi:hypothetical protein AB5N19_01557 [Seiridium cardinale]
MAPHVSNVLETERAEDPAASKEKLLEVVKKANVWVVKNKPSLTQQELDTVVEGPEIDEHWTEADEEQSVHDWHSDPMRKHMLDNKSNLSLGGPWRYAARFYGVTIEEIISPLYDLEYDASSHAKMVTINGQSQPHPYWSQLFCKSLEPLLTHDMWMDAPGILATCLQYVVKCQTNDQRVMRWPRTNWTTDKFFDVFAKVAKKQNGTRSVIEIHDEVEQRLEPLRSPWSRLFREIEAVSFNTRVAPKREPVVADKDIGTYKINKRVLDKLTEALDAQKDRNGLPVYRNADFTCRAAEAARSSYDLPKSGDLEKMRDRILLTMRQESAKEANTAAAKASASAGQGSSPDPGQQAGQVQPTSSGPPTGLPSVRELPIHPVAASEVQDQEMENPFEDEEPSPHPGESRPQREEVTAMDMDGPMLKFEDEQQADPEASTSPRLPGLTSGGFGRFHLSNAYREAHYPDEGSLDEEFDLDEAIELRKRRNTFAEDLD